MGIYVGRWDCDYCGNIGNLGPHTHCSECGGLRSEDVVFYMPRGIDSKVTDEDAIAEAKEGANWVCGFCNNGNRNSYKACVSCGAMKDDAQGELKVREFSEREVPRSSQPEQQMATKAQPNRSNAFMKFIVGFAVLAFGFFGLSQISSTIEVQVTSIEWNRTIEVEEYKEVEEEDWSLPSEGKMIESFKAIHHYDRRVTGYQTRTRTVQEAAGSEQYVCGKRDLGNGYFEDKYCTRTIYRDRQEQYEEPIYQEFPVYKTKYKYLIYRWKPYEEYKTNGNDKKPEWATLPSFVETKKEQFRIQAEKETYYFAIKDHKDETRWYETNFDYWDNNVFIRKSLNAKKSTIFGYFQQLEDESQVRPVER